jgi:hypothetical protein
MFEHGVPPYPEFVLHSPGVATNPIASDHTERKHAKGIIDEQEAPVH